MSSPPGRLRPGRDAEALEFHLGSRIEYARRRIALDQRIKLTGRNLRHRVFHVNPLAEILARHVRARNRGKRLRLPRAQSAIQHSNVRVAAFFQKRGDTLRPRATLVHANHGRGLHGHETLGQELHRAARGVRRQENLFFVKLHRVAHVEHRVRAIAFHPFLQFNRGYSFHHVCESFVWGCTPYA